MLVRIFIKNFALIDSLELTLKPGLQVITGETGAGKSIILGALRLILGERADVKSIANPEQKSIVEAEFTIAESLRYLFEENDLDFEEHTLIRREILPSGKSRAFINDVPVTLEILRELSTKLIDIHSQFQTSSLFSAEYQFKILDGLAKNSPLLSEYQSVFSTFKELQRKLQSLQNSLKESNKEADYKNYLLKELQDADLDSVNWEDMQEQLAMQENAEALSENLSEILARFDAEQIGVIDAMNDIRAKLGKTATLSHHFTEISQRFEENFVELKDIIFTLQDEAEKIEQNPETLQLLTTRINALNALLLKHGAEDINALLQIRDDLQREQSSFEGLEEEINNAEKQLEQAKSSLEKLAAKLAANRKKTVPLFVEKTQDLLKQLGLDKARLDVSLHAAKEYNAYGKEEIGLLFQANSGFPLKPIQDAVSGGERSRVMLAVKKIMAENSELPTLVLDEIDTGVSGRVADEMGKVMQQMSADMQLIVITHLAQVAAKGNDNYKVAKFDVDGKTRSTINPLSQEEKLTEIAQLLSGAKITDAAIKQAKELM